MMKNLFYLLFIPITFNFANLFSPCDKDSSHCSTTQDSTLFSGQVDTIGIDLTNAETDTLKVKALIFKNVLLTIPAIYYNSLYWNNTANETNVLVLEDVYQVTKKVYGIPYDHKFYTLSWKEVTVYAIINKEVKADTVRLRLIWENMKWGN